MKYKVNYIEDTQRMWNHWYRTGESLTFEINDIGFHLNDKSIVIFSIEMRTK